MKKIKLLGILSAIVTVTLSAFIPVLVTTVAFMEEGISEVLTGEFTEEYVTIGLMCVPVYLMLLFAPSFIDGMFSYLNSRKESDFYHAIPYKRQTVYVSFTLAALTWCLGIIVLCVGASAVLWWVSPYTTISISSVPLLIFAVFLACAFLMSFMTVAKALTGTKSSNLFIYILLLSLVRIVCSLVSWSVSTMAPIWVAGDTLARFLNISFNLPIAILCGTFDASFFTDVPLYIYTFVVTLALFVLGGVIYKLRRSEMASKSAPSRALQHVYRFAFTTPIILLFVSLCFAGVMSAGLFLTMFVFTMLTYFLYELITTRSPKSMLTSAIFLPILLFIAGGYAACVAFGGFSVLANTPDAEDIEYVRIPEVVQGTLEYYDPDAYENENCANVKIKDETVNKYIADAIEFSVASVKDGTFDRTRIYADGVGGKAESTRYNKFTVHIKLKNGTSISRKLKISETDYTKMLDAAASTDEFALAYLKIPKPESIASYPYARGLSDEDLHSIYSSFYNEYTGLSMDERRDIKNGNVIYKYKITFGISENFKKSEFTCIISEKTPNTLSLLSTLLSNSESNDYRSNGKEGDAMSKLTNEKMVLEFFDVFAEDIYTTSKDVAYDRTLDNVHRSLSVSSHCYSPDGRIMTIDRQWFDNEVSRRYDLTLMELFETLVRESGDYSPDKLVLVLSISYSCEVVGDEYKVDSAMLILFVDKKYEETLEMFLIEKEPSTDDYYTKDDYWYDEEYSFSGSIGW